MAIDGITSMKLIAGYGMGLLAAETPNTSTVDFLQNLGALGIALVCIYLLLGRQDRREDKHAQEAGDERRALLSELAETRHALIEALKEGK